MRREVLERGCWGVGVEDCKKALGITPEQQEEYLKWRKKEERKELTMDALKALAIVLGAAMVIYISRLS